MLHPPYSPDLLPSDYCLFWSLQNSLNGETFNDDEAVKSHLVQFFADKDQKLNECGIMKLPERWQKVIKQNRKYIIVQSLFLVFKKTCLICMKKTAITSGTTQYIVLISSFIRVFLLWNVNSIICFKDGLIENWQKFKREGTERYEKINSFLFLLLSGA